MEKETENIPKEWMESPLFNAMLGPGKSTAASEDFQQEADQSGSTSLVLFAEKCMQLELSVRDAENYLFITSEVETAIGTVGYGLGTEHLSLERYKDLLSIGNAEYHEIVNLVVNSDYWSEETEEGFETEKERNGAIAICFYLCEQDPLLTAQMLFVMKGRHFQRPLGMKVKLDDEDPIMVFDLELLLENLDELIQTRNMIGAAELVNELGSRRNLGSIISGYQQEVWES